MTSLPAAITVAQLNARLHQQVREMATHRLGCTTRRGTAWRFQYIAQALRSDLS
jgi:hypothetical protein